MKSIYLKTQKSGITIGDDYPIIINCNVGINSSNDYPNEIKKIDSIFSDISSRPHTMMDLSTWKESPSLAKYIIDTYDIPVGIVPSYLSFVPNQGIKQSVLIDNIIKNAKEGVAFMTMHFTSDWDIYQEAKRDRKIPVTSRGGSVVLSDIMINKRRNNVFIDNIDLIIEIALEYNFAISLGSTFRPAGIIDACDKSHIMETNRQMKICHYLQNHGVNVIVENVGHITINKIHSHSKLLQAMNAPIMPLGPSPIDSALGADHIAGAIGAAFMGYYGCAHIINAISPSEHSTSFFTAEDMKQAILAARIAAKTINVLNFSEYENIENTIYAKRASENSCLVKNEDTCTRCALLCPLKMGNYEM